MMTSAYVLVEVFVGLSLDFNGDSTKLAIIGAFVVGGALYWVGVSGLWKVVFFSLNFQLVSKN